MGMMFQTDQIFLDVILDLEAERGWYKMNRGLTVQNRRELR